ncbi:hypothetical protein AMAG_13213 [Allomyces macrogynus ATCC 38327]|uniref:MPN domain-containing protein n=1 Tax=Allomyces macrogynus (strain ATCC 38327) TaxID=578462 RepID=A0A0L0SZX1_ALLM3|nr:hypothetical protein AMAG_13213 [Allomyces macrogynus ATCC 38327]|eukprot:KNE68042.1 hypothetical protein AMAG_13213 [Allomyces macrogynus ATCC 38327]
MSPRPDLAVHAAAFAAILLHALKHVHKPVFGVLLATPATGAIARVVPVSHTPLARAACLLEVALEQVHKYTAADKNLEVVGLYYADANAADDVNADANVVAVATQVFESLGVPDGVLLRLNTLKLSADPFALALDVVLPTRSAAIRLVEPPSTLKNLPKVLGPLNQGLFDFDDHLEDVARDWLGNARVVGELQRQLVA